MAWLRACLKTLFPGIAKLEASRSARWKRALPAWRRHLACGFWRPLAASSEFSNTLLDAFPREKSGDLRHAQPFRLPFRPCNVVAELHLVVSVQALICIKATLASRR